MKKAIVLCNGNSFRSQMAEAWLKHFSSNKAEIHSAGVRPSYKVSRKATQLMAEKNISLESHQSEHANDYTSTAFDYVICLGKDVAENCPQFTGHPQYITQVFPDPEIEENQSEEEYWKILQKVRDDIMAWAKDFVEKNI